MVRTKFLVGKEKKNERKREREREREKRELSTNDRF